MVNMVVMYAFTLLRSYLDVGALQDKVCVGQHTYFLNGPSMEEPNADEINALGFTERIVKYKKILRHGVLYCSSTMKASKRDSSACARFIIKYCATVRKFGKNTIICAHFASMVLLSPYQVTSI